MITAEEAQSIANEVRRIDPLLENRVEKIIKEQAKLGKVGCTVMRRYETRDEWFNLKKTLVENGFTLYNVSDRVLRIVWILN